MIFELSLANETPEESRAIALAADLYAALSRRNGAAIQNILAADLEMWFHGPPSYQFLARIFSGDTSANFVFDPCSISAVGSMVFAEGYDKRRCITWIHAWTVTGGIITHVREYFNTSLTVTRLEVTDEWDCSSSSSGSSSSSSLHCPSVWESTLPARVGKSVPGLVLAI